MSEDKTDMQAAANRADFKPNVCQTTGNGPARLGGARAVPAEPGGPLRWSGEAAAPLGL